MRRIGPSLIALLAESRLLGERRMLLTTAATLMLIVVLLLSAAFSFYASTATTAAAIYAQRERAWSIRYVNARYAIADERSIDRKYQLYPSAAVARARRKAETEVARILDALATSGPPQHASEARYLAKLNVRYVAAARSLFDAISAGQLQRSALIDRIEIEPTYSTMENRINERLNMQREKTDRAVGDLEKTQRYVIRIAIGLSLLGLGSVFAFLFIIATYRKRLIDGHRATVRLMEEANFEDSLTKIGNHRSFKKDIARELSLAWRHGLPLTLAVLDIDDFKLVNDQYGHVHGDRVLKDLADILRSNRAGDGAYRVGGDEFALVLPHTKAVNAHALLDRIRIAFSRLPHGATISIGYSSIEGVLITAETLQNRADAALYLTKRGGRNGVSCFEESTKNGALISAERVNQLRTMLASESMAVEFQPIWDLDREAIVAFEVLARPPASFGFSGPQDAFDLAERIGCVHELDRASHLTALRHAADLPDGALLFLNFSPQTLDRDFDIADFVGSVLASGMTPKRIVIEITERGIAHLDNVVAIAHALRAKGFGIALDDTGAGHAGLEIMSRLRFDYVKIDRAIIVQAMSDLNASGVVAAIVAFANVTGAYVIAEGIEDREMLAFIERNGTPDVSAGCGIRGIQGYFVQRPQPTFTSDSDLVVIRSRMALDRERYTRPPESSPSHAFGFTI